MVATEQEFKPKRIDSTFQSRLAAREKAAGIVPAEQLITPEDRARQYTRLEAMVGNTPLERIPTSNGNIIWLKRESENPSESHYDRASIAVLKRLETDGFIKPGDKILEGTSGSAGRSFAWACSRLGYKLDMIVPHEEEFPEERKRDIEALGAHVIHAREKGGIGKVTKLFYRKMVELKRDGYEREDLVLEGKPIVIFRKGNETIVAPNHSEIGITPNAFKTIAEEVVEQLPEGVTIDTFISTLGNGSTLKGISEGLKAAYGKLTVIGVETMNAPTNAIRKIREELITSDAFSRDQFIPGKEDPVAMAELRRRFGITYNVDMPRPEEQQYHDSFGASTYGYEPPFVEVENLDSIVLVKDEWRDFKRRVNTYADIFGDSRKMIGNTTAENLYVAHMLAKKPGVQNRNILVINYDKGDQYKDWPPVRKEYTYPHIDTVKDEFPAGLTHLKAA